MKNAKEIMEALAAGETLEYSDDTRMYALLDRQGHITANFLEMNLLLLYPSKWRVKPKVQQINGVEVPTPHRKKPEIGQEYFTPSVNNLTGYRDYIWRDSHTDNRRLSAGVIHLEPEAAAQHTKAFLSLTAE